MPEKVLPKTLDETYTFLDSWFEKNERMYIKAMSKRDLWKLHSTIGRKLRNDLGLWGKSELKDYFTELGVSHPDEISGIILRAYWAKMNSYTLNLEEEIKYCIEIDKENGHY